MPPRPKKIRTHRKYTKKPRTSTCRFFTTHRRLKGRKAVARKLRILQRDNYTCQHCNKQFPHKQLQADHIEPLWTHTRHDKNTTDAELQTLCIPCHDIKSAAERTILNAQLREAGLGNYQVPEG